jgi:hypothetical protein
VGEGDRTPAGERNPPCPDRPPFPADGHDLLLGFVRQQREAIDGDTAFPLMAAAEGWPATPWMQPWEPTRS